MFTDGNSKKFNFKPAKEVDSLKLANPEEKQGRKVEREATYEEVFGKPKDADVLSN